MRAHKILPNGTAVRVMEKQDMTGTVVGHSVIEYGSGTRLMYIVHLDYDLGDFIHRDNVDRCLYITHLVVHPDNVQAISKEVAHEA